MNKVLWPITTVILLGIGVAKAEALRFYGDAEAAAVVQGVEQIPQTSVEFVPDDYSPYQSAVVPLARPLASAPGLRRADRLYLQRPLNNGLNTVPYGAQRFSRYPRYAYPSDYPPSVGAYTQPFDRFPMGKFLTPGGFPMSW